MKDNFKEDKEYIPYPCGKCVGRRYSAVSNRCRECWSVSVKEEWRDKKLTGKSTAKPVTPVKLDDSLRVHHEVL